MRYIIDVLLYLVKRTTCQSVHNHTAGRLNRYVNWTSGQGGICGQNQWGEDDRGAVGAEASAAGARIEAPKAPRGVGCGEGVSPSKFFDFGSQNGEFWCILGVLVTVLLLLSFTHKTSVIWTLPIFFCNFSLQKNLAHFLSF